MSAIVYHGRRTREGAVVVVETEAGEQLGLLAHHVRHSPSGFSWGYAGVRTRRAVVRSFVLQTKDSLEMTMQNRGLIGSVPGWSAH